MLDTEPGDFPIAIIGIGCRLPGSTSSPEKLWDFLKAKKSAKQDTPMSRFSIDAFYHPDTTRHGTVYNRGGYYLDEDLADFDASFFSISPTEAMAMDPMQRMLLEVIYEAMERAGIPLQKMSGTNTSCYVGCFTSDYDEMQRSDPELQHKYNSVGTGQSILANRISHFFNLKGPSMTVDTACSSSLVAVHLACQSLRTRESSMAIVGASNTIILPTMQMAMAAMGFLSPDSVDYSFDSRANGYARGEGIAAVILKPLELAIQAGDSIQAVIRSTAVNSDGRTPGMTMPSSEAQCSLINSAYQNAKLDLATTAYFEAHGTGTPIGDPTEARAIGETFAASRSCDKNGGPIPLYVGTIKPNLGHLEGAAGLAGLIKATLIVNKGVILPNIHFEEGNAAIDFSAWRIKLPENATQWPVPGLRRASVNSFGYGGTNAHVILDDVDHYFQVRRQVPVYPSITPDLIIPAPHGLVARIFPLSTNDMPALEILIKNITTYIRNHKSSTDVEFLDSLAHTLSQRRSLLPARACLVARTTTELLQRLESSPPMSMSNASSELHVGYIFTGQGAQWYGMGRELLAYPVFRASIIRSGKTISGCGADWSILTELLKDEKDSRVQDAVISQPLCTAIQIAMVDLLAHWGIRPHRVVGHSSGEIAAAYSIGALSLSSSMTIAYHRGLLSAKVKDLGYSGSMMAVGMSEKEAQQAIDDLPNSTKKVVIACVNSPSSVTVAGDEDAVNELLTALADKHIFARKLTVDTAYHSHHMWAVAELYRLAISSVLDHAGQEQGTMYSSVTGKAVRAKDLGTSYWVRNLVSRVRFSDALSSLLAEDGPDSIIEIGPHAALATPTKQIMEATGVSNTQYFSLIYRGKDAVYSIQEVATKIFRKGHPIDIQKINNPGHILPHSLLVDLPSYPWSHSRKYWHESRLSKNYRLRQFRRTNLLGAPVSDWNPLEPRWRGFVRLTEQPWIRGHKVQGTVLYPAAGYLCMAIEAVAQLNRDSDMPIVEKAAEYRLRKVTFSRAIVVPDTATGVEVSISLKPRENASASEKWYNFNIYSYDNNTDWVENCTGLVGVTSQSLEPDSVKRAVSKLSKAHAVCQVKMCPNCLYGAMESVGLTFDEHFQGLTEISAKPGQAVGTVKITDTRSRMPHQFEYLHVVHPTTLDSMMQLTVAALSGGDKGKITAPAVPTSIEEVYVAGAIDNQSGCNFQTVAKAQRQGPRKANSNIVVLDDKASRIVVGIERLDVTTVQGINPIVSAATVPKHCFRAVWEPDVYFISRIHLEEQLRAEIPIDYFSPRQDMELLAMHYIRQVLHHVSRNEIALPHFLRLFDYFKHEETRIVSELNIAPINRLEKLLKEFSSTETADCEANMLVRMGVSLPSILRGESEALSIMMKDGMLHDYYTVAAGARSTYPQLARYMTILSHKYPDLKYLEIGAGTGGATASILPVLSGSELSQYPRLESYTYTDVSPAFFDAASRKFERWKDYIDFKRLDIEKDPVTQGFLPGSFDVIVAANALHATSDIKRTIKHVHSLLKPSGKLILLEVTQQLFSSSVISGSLPGWWNATEEWRKHGPILSEKQWEDILTTNGFSLLEASSPDDKNLARHVSRIMITSKLETETNKPPPRRVLILKRGAYHYEADALTTALKVLLHRSDWITSVSTLFDLEKADLTDAFIVSLIELEEVLIRDIPPEHLELLKRIAIESSGLLWVTRGHNPWIAGWTELSLFQGVARTLRTEYGSFPCGTLALDKDNFMHPSSLGNLIWSVCESMMKSSRGTKLGQLDSEFCEMEGVIHVKRAIEDAQANKFVQMRTNPGQMIPILSRLPDDRILRPHFGESGNPASAVWKEEKSRKILADHVVIEVKAVGLNKMDLLTATGEGNEKLLGVECAGVVINRGRSSSPPHANLNVGDRVAVLHHGCYANNIICPRSSVQKIPANMTMATAATVPLSYVTAYYCLVEISRMEALKRRKILICDATSDIGLAALLVARYLKAKKVVATVRSEQQKKYLVETCHHPENAVFLESDPFLAGSIRDATDGAGADIILVLRDAPSFRVIWECAAEDSSTMIIRNDGQGLSTMEIPPPRKNLSIELVDMSQVLRTQAELCHKIFFRVMDSIRNGQMAHSFKREVLGVTAHASIIPIISFPWSDLALGMEYLGGSEMMSKVIMYPFPDDVLPVVLKVPKPWEFRGQNASYLLAGGLGGLGLSISRWMVSNGAKNLIYVARSDPSPQARAALDEFKAARVRVSILKCDLADQTRLCQLIQQVRQRMPPIRGVIQAAMELNDSMFANMTANQFKATLRPKVHGSWALHVATQEEAKDFFIMLSSAAGFCGNIGQANYAAACEYQTTLAEYRRSLGMNATAVDLGIVTGVGYVEEKANARVKEKLLNLGLLEIGEKEMLAILEHCIREGKHGLSHMITGLHRVGSASARFNTREQSLCHLDHDQPEIRSPIANANGSVDSSQEPLTTLLETANSVVQATRHMIDALRRKLARSLMMSVDDVRPNSSIAAFGVDSLVGVEIKSWLFRETKAEVSVFEILQAPSVVALAENIVIKSPLTSVEAKEK